MGLVRAARITAVGTGPELHDIDPPARGDGEALVDVAAVGLNPVDIAVAAGRFYGGHPPLPYIPGCEAVGRLRSGQRVHAFGAGLGLSRDGALAEAVCVPEAALTPFDVEVDDVTAAACGIAGVAGWAGVRRARIGEDDRVLILGATGTVGRVALQAARLQGADIVVAAGRRSEGLERALELGADAVVRLENVDEFAEDILDTFAGDGPTVIVDPLWGPPFAAALQAAAPGARAVHIGQSAGAETTLLSSVVRGKQLEILGYSNFGIAREEYGRAYLDLVAEVAAGRIQLDVESFPLDRVDEAWRRQAEGAGAKLVLTV